MSSLMCRRLVGRLFRFDHVRSIHRSAVWSGQVVQFKLSDIGEGIAEVQLKEWHIKAGDRVNQFDNLCEVQSDKASVTITSRYDGVIKKLYYKVDDMAPVGKALVDIELDGGAEDSSDDDKAAQSSVPEMSREKSDDKSMQKASTDSSPSSGKKLATPAVRRIAMESKIKLSDVDGTGRDGRVLKEDVLRFLGQIGPAKTSAPVEQRRPAISGQDKTVPIRGYTRIMMKTMTQANLIPHFGYNDEVVVNRLIDLRAQLKALAAEKGTKMSYMPLFIKAASLALAQYPVLNSSLDEKLDNLTYKSAHNFCVAMDTPGGLIVPNIKHCEQRNLWEIALELNRLQEAGKRQQLDRSDLQDGTFTLSNIGAIGGTYASPVIFPPQVAIGALGKIEVHPRYDANMQIFPAHIVKVSWAADHRVIDGATMARFSNVWKEYLENPALMIAEMR